MIEPTEIELYNKEICKLFEFNIMDVMDYKLDQGHQFAAEMGKDSEQFHQALINSPDYWIWWMLMCARRDRRILEYALPVKNYVEDSSKRVLIKATYDGLARMLFTTEMMWAFYEQVQDYKQQRFWPNDVVVERSIRHYQSISNAGGRPHKTVNI